MVLSCAAPSAPGPKRRIRFLSISPPAPFEPSPLSLQSATSRPAGDLGRDLHDDRARPALAGTHCGPNPRADAGLHVPVAQRWARRPGGSRTVAQRTAAPCRLGGPTKGQGRGTVEGRGRRRGGGCRKNSPNVSSTPFICASGPSVREVFLFFVFWLVGWRGGRRDGAAAS